jgi:hypothetical protein
MNKMTIGVGVLVIAAVAGLVLVMLPDKTNAPTTGGNTQNQSGDVIVTNLTPNSKITSPVTITGTAKGYYFEASFPIEILDAQGNVIGQNHADATSDWMVEGPVPFTATVTFTAQPAGSAGTIRFKNDNPSGLPENDKHTDFPIKF